MKKGSHHTEESKRKIGPFFKGKHLSDEIKRKLSDSHIIHGEGRFPYPLDFNNDLKTLVRERDHFNCQLCKKSEKHQNRKLCVHHIDYDKENLNPKNLVTLCHVCNSKVNYNRDFWTKFFQSKLKLYYRKKKCV